MTFVTGEADICWPNVAPAEAEMHKMLFINTLRICLETPARGHYLAQTTPVHRDWPTNRPGAGHAFKTQRKEKDEHA
jgi:hypothetical protein